MSRAERPKAFLEVVSGAGTGLSAAARRANLIPGAAVPATISHTRHAARLRAQAGLGAILLEPESRGTAAAVAAGAAWLALGDPGAVLVVLPADQHVDDEVAFAAAIATAVDIARDGAIAVLGARAVSAETAYGYILPGPDASGVAAVRRFHEKPDRAQAKSLVAEGALWNCGVFVGAAATLLEELWRQAPEIAAAAVTAVAEGIETPDGFVLGEALRTAPMAAFDTAVMERTDRGRVIAVDCGWSDVGAWDSVWRASGRDSAGIVRVGDAEVSDGRDVLARAAPGVRLRVVGVSGVAVVAERDGVIVTALDHAQAVRDVGAGARFASLADAARTLADWLRTSALPIWGAVGFDSNRGDFREALTWSGRSDDPRRRLRVQARQTFVFATAAADGLPGPWLDLARRALPVYLEAARRGDGLYKSALSPDGRDVDAEARLYEHAFLLLALAGLARAEPGERRWRVEADGVRRTLSTFEHAGGYREASDTPYQADPQMHLLEAALAWRALENDGVWSELADRLADLAISRMIDPSTGAIREIFDADWRALAGQGGRVEPGHQFEWAWLLGQWGGSAPGVAQRLFAAGERGFDHRRGVTVDALWDDLSVRAAGARLWPQTERLRAALMLGEVDAALSAANAIWRFLDLPVRGVWRERMDEAGGFLEGSSPATSLYHLHGAIAALVGATGEAW